LFELKKYLELNSISGGQKIGLILRDI